MMLRWGVLLKSDDGRRVWYGDAISPPVVRRYEGYTPIADHCHLVVYDYDNDYRRSLAPFSA